MTEAEWRRRGAAEPVRVSVRETNTPWMLPVDAVVLSVGRDLGELAQAFQDQFPQARWHSVSFDEITPDRPDRLALQDQRRAVGPWLGILATAHQWSAAPTLDSVVRATVAALREAADAGARSVALPMLATGVLGLPMSAVAAVAVPAAVAAAQEVSLQELVLFGRREADVRVLRAARPSDVLAGGLSGDWVDPNVGIPLTKDQLGVGPYASMLATVISDRTTPTPLSVGIFGEWGSGKSHFMGLLRHQVAELAASGHPGYCADVVQIGFNAWHYADANIWASLGDEIFRQLAGPEADSETRRRQLRAELAERLDQRREIEETTRQARSTAAALQAGVDTAAAAKERRASDLIAALRKSPTVARQLDSLWRKLGITDDAERAKLLAAQLRGTLTEADALRRVPSDRAGRSALAVAALVLGAGLVLTAFAPEARGWLAGAGGAFAMISGLGLAALTRARKGLRALRSLAEDIRVGRDREALYRESPRIAEALDALRQAEADQRVAEAQLDDVVAHVGELGRQLAELSPGRRLYSFLADRAQGDSYARNLGLISVIRKDFEQLVALMADWRDHPDRDDTAHRPIDRIVLYIDDLDRCGPRQVVEVLQAVHLLLALDLFVVVIGVDPRWLLRSLSSHYHELLDHGPAGVPTADRWRVTPEDYLEKIINIPVMLPGMPTGSLRQLLSSIVADAMPPEEEPPATAVNRAAAPAPRGEAAPPRFTAEANSEIGSRRTSGAAATPPRPLTGPELDLLSALDVLIDTPREAKRLFNLYRMLRATRDLSPASRFLGTDGEPGEYQAVGVLLGMLTGHARLTGQALDTRPDPDRGVTGGLTHRPAYGTWEAYVADLAPHDAANRAVGPLAHGSVPEWSRLHAGLLRLSPEVTLPDLSVFQLWAPRIRRFSYVLSRSEGPETAEGPAHPARPEQLVRARQRRG